VGKRMGGRYVISANVPRTYDCGDAEFVAASDERALAILDELLDPAIDAGEVAARHDVWDSLCIDYAREQGCTLTYVESRAVGERRATTPGRGR
jgi:predicted nucleic acid-binding protein